MKESKMTSTLKTNLFDWGNCTYYIFRLAGRQAIVNTLACSRSFPRHISVFSGKNERIETKLDTKKLRQKGNPQENLDADREHGTLAHAEKNPPQDGPPLGNITTSWPMNSDAFILVFILRPHI